MTLKPGIVTVLLHKSDDLVILAFFNIALQKSRGKKIIVFASSLLSDCLNCLTSCV